jgi:hypothetical protein
MTRLARENVACRTEVARSHVSGLLVQGSGPLLRYRQNKNVVKGADSTLHAANVRTDVAVSRFQSCNTVSALQKYSIVDE